MKDKLKTTLKAWPAIAAATIALCFLTQGVAKLFGIDLPDQQNVEVVRSWLMHAFDSFLHFLNCASLLAQVVILLPVIEEFVFRWLLFMLPYRFVARRTNGGLLRTAEIAFLVVSSALFSAAHYARQPFPDAAFIALFFFGLAQCWLYRKTDRIWCTMLNHALFNLTNVVLMFVVPASS